jgi:hypothetical protein
MYGLIDYILNQMELGKVLESSKVSSILKKSNESRNVKSSEYNVKFGPHQFISLILSHFKYNTSMLDKISPIMMNSDSVKSENLQKYFELIIENIDFSNQFIITKLNNVFSAKRTLQKNISGKFVETVIAHNLTCKWILSHLLGF